MSRLMLASILFNVMIIQGIISCLLTFTYIFLSPDNTTLYGLFLTASITLGLFLAGMYCYLTSPEDIDEALTESKQDNLSKGDQI